MNYGKEYRIECDGGFLTYRFCHGGMVEITDIHVDNDKRRTGLGRSMIDELFQTCKVEGTATSAYAITRADNISAQQFYEALRFHACPLRRFYDPATKCIDAVLYVRSVGGPV